MLESTLIFPLTYRRKKKKTFEICYLKGCKILRVTTYKSLTQKEKYD